jgi:hypothetical protein
LSCNLSRRFTVTACSFRYSFEVTFLQRVEEVVRHLAEIYEYVAVFDAWKWRSDPNASFASSFSPFAIEPARSAAAPVISCIFPAPRPTAARTARGARSGARTLTAAGLARRTCQPFNCWPVTPCRRRTSDRLKKKACDRETVPVARGPDVGHCAQPFKSGKNPSLPP